MCFHECIISLKLRHASLPVTLITKSVLQEEMERNKLISDSSSSNYRNRKRTAVVIIIVVFCLSYFLTRITRSKVNSRDAQVTIDGGKIAGYNVGHVSVIKGIPYAKPPVSMKRWLPPEPCGKGECWNGTFDATKFGEMCFQTDVMNTSIVKGQEDYLFVNVWSPNLNSKNKLPVLVFIRDHIRAKFRGYIRTGPFDLSNDQRSFSWSHHDECSCSIQQVSE